MDIFSLTVGFLVGTITGAAGNYIGQKSTDKRRAIEAERRNKIVWGNICSKFPTIISEMREDVLNPEYVGVRQFYAVLSGGTLSISEPSFIYNAKEHLELKAAISLLEDEGFICDITDKDCPKYRMYEHFVDKLKNA